MRRTVGFSWALIVVLVLGGLASKVSAQTASTGALNGTVFDASHGVVPGAKITVTNQSTGAVRTVVTGPDGAYLVPLLPPGSYRIEASHAGFKVVTYANIHVSVTETATLNIHLQVGTTAEEVTVRAEASQLQTTSAALGSVVNERMVESLPLVTRNYTQILGLMPGVSGGANNAVEIGRGGSSLSVGASTYSIAGGSTTDNNFQMNGTQVNDLMGAGSFSGGVPVPNPDAIQEFKVQTGQYSAAFGRNAGANVDVITKSGTNQYHGNAWEYFRNTDLNANDFFLNRAGAPRGVLNQNQFGFTFGGPIVKKKALFFVSYQGTRQKDGLDPSSLTTGTLPVGLTNSASSRTASALGAEFGGQAGIFGIPVASDGSNISPNALAVLNAQTSSGFVVPAPTNTTTGATTYSIPSIYNDDQFIVDLDLYQGQKSHLSGKFFFMDSNQAGSLPPNQLGQPAITVPGFSQGIPDGFRDFSLIHTYTFSSHLLNQAVLGFHRLSSGLQQAYPNVSYANSAGCGGSGPISLSSLCVPAPAFDNPYPSIVVIGGFNVGGNGQRLGIMAQNFYDFSDQVTYVRGKHTLYFGGGISRSQVNFVGFGYFGALLFPSFPDFLEGNVYVSVDAPLVADRAWRVWDGNLYAEDDYQVLPRLTLNLGFRYEREGNIGDAMGRSAIFNPALANPNPPASGTLQGYVVASNYSGGAIPPGVTQASTNTAMDNANQNVWEPRLGFAWQLPGTNRMVLRGGYGIYAVRVTNQPYLQLLASWPWGSVRQFVLPSSISTALPPLAQPLPYFPPYSPTTQLTTTSFSADFRPPLVQQYSLGLQTELAPNWKFEVGYQGSRGTHLNLVRNFDQALSASPSNPIRGQTTNTLANVGLRVPIQGFSIPGSSIFESIGSSWYNALNASLTKRFSHGLQFQVAYTWASALENAPIYVQGANGGALIGNQNNLNSNYGYDGFVRPQRLVISYVYNLPGPANLSSLMGRVLGGWSVSGVTTFQSGQRMTLTDSNLLNAFGITSSGFGDGDRIQIASGCTYAKLATSGSVTSKLDNYFNTSCIGIPPTIGADGLAQGFGNSGNGIVRGPDQRVFDISIAKQTPLGQSDVRNIEFRAEFFNAFNTPSFSNPVTGGNLVTLIPGTTTPVFVPSATFGQSQSTSVNPRIIQLALKLNF
jgi:outer membrane receptor protein involved in Fe transport